jgi:hypothetical protein
MRDRALVTASRVEAVAAALVPRRRSRHPPRGSRRVSSDHARSALDQLVWQLVILADHEPTRANGFPIYDDRAAYRRAERRLLRGVDAPHAAEIEGLQPFNSPYRGATSWRCSAT